MCILEKHPPMLITPKVRAQFSAKSKTTPQKTPSVFLEKTHLSCETSRNELFFLSVLHGLVLPFFDHIFCPPAGRLFWSKFSV